MVLVCIMSQLSEVMSKELRVCEAGVDERSVSDPACGGVEQRRAECRATLLCSTRSLWSLHAHCPPRLGSSIFWNTLFNINRFYLQCRECTVSIRCVSIVFFFYRFYV